MRTAWVFWLCSLAFGSGLGFGVYFADSVYQAIAMAEAPNWPPDDPEPTPLLTPQQRAVIEDAESAFSGLEERK